MVTREQVEDQAIRDLTTGTQARLEDIGRHVVIFTRAYLPPELAQAWTQHVRDFDTAHPNCHFEMAIDAGPDESLPELVDKLRVNPGLTFQQIFRRMDEADGLGQSPDRSDKER